MESGCSVITRKMLERVYLFAVDSCSSADENEIGIRNANKKALIMTCLLSFNFRRLVKLLFIFIIFFVAACNDKTLSLTACLSAEEKADLEYFIRWLVFENHGAYALFGSKPMCIMSLRDINTPIDWDAFQAWFDSLPEDEKAKVKSVLNKAKPAPKFERNPYDGWLALKKTLKNLKMGNYLFRLVPLRNAGHYDLVLINVQSTALVLAENYAVFKEAAGGMDFHPLQAVFELQNPDSVFWKNVFSMQNHTAKGLLFGFGLSNSLFGHWSFSSSQGKLNLPSDEYREEIEDYLKNAPFSPTISSQTSNLDFTIPLFGTVLGDGTVKKYAKEKVAIEKIYRGKDIVEVTLQRLTGQK
jgi:hypothetical protein